MPIQARLRIRPDREHPLFPAETRYFSLPAKPTENLDRFAADIVQKEGFPLSGQTLRNGLEVEYTLAIPEVEFDRRSIRFLPTGRLPDDLQVTSDGLADRNGNRVVPVLHRPTLHEQRRWELLKTVDRNLRPEQKILVIAEEFGLGNTSFSRDFSQICSAAGQDLEFLPWAASGDRSGSRLLESLPFLLRQIGGSQAELVILIPPPRSRSRGLSDWENLRVLALLLEKLGSQETVRRLILSTPIPLPQAPISEEDSQYEEKLCRLCREYGIELLELSALARQLAGYQATAPEDPSIPDRSSRLQLLRALAKHLR